MSNNSVIFQLCAVKRTRYGSRFCRSNWRTDATSRPLNRLFSALLGAILTLSPCLASAAGTWVWTASLYCKRSIKDVGSERRHMLCS
jgi:hypothetical protein